MNKFGWLAVAGACCFGTLVGIALQPKPSAANTLTVFGKIDNLKDRSGEIPMRFQFKDRHSGTVVAEKEGLATVENGSYVVDLDTGGLKGGEVYAVVPVGAAPAAINYVRLQAGFPGTVDVGHVNLSGTMKLDKLRIGTLSTTGARIRVEDGTAAGAISGKSNGVAVTASGTGASDSLEVSNTGTGDGLYVTSNGNSSDAIFATQSNPNSRCVAEITHYGAGPVTVMKGDHQNSTGNSVTGFFINRSATGKAVYADTYDATNSGNYNVFAEHRSVLGTSVFSRIPSNASGTALYGTGGASGTGFAVYAAGRLTATGTKAFQIDHPLSPSQMYLNHYCAEGPEPYNVYRGSTRLDSNGKAWVALPPYFASINRNETYTLTPVGAAMPNLHLATKVNNGRFQIAGGAPGAEVDWCVTGVRNDKWVQAYGYQAEQPKPAQARGTYVNPELWGRPESDGQDFQPVAAPQPRSDTSRR